MPKEEWGTKRLCPKTGRRFYDLNRDPIVSPYTGEVVNLETGRATRTMVADKSDAANPATKDEDEEVILEEDDDNADVDLGDEVLDEDEDDNVSLDDIADMSSEDNED